MICPKCKHILNKDNNIYRCDLNHSYDIAKSGYINLLLSKTKAGDNKLLVNSRISFLSKDYYKPLATYICNQFQILKQQKILDCGCGTGYYTTLISEDFNSYGIDISKTAIEYASKHDHKSLYIVASNKNIPFENNYFDCLLYIFAPFFEVEASRVLTNKGIIINVTPGPKHLFELKQILYSNPYENNNNIIKIKNYNLFKSKEIKYTIELDNTDFHNLISMTPYVYKTSQKVLENVHISDRIIITVDFIISFYQKDNFLSKR